MFDLCNSCEIFFSTKRKNYTAEFKLKVISVDVKSVREFKKRKEKVEKMDRRKRSKRYRKLFGSELEEILCRMVKVQQGEVNSAPAIKIRIREKKNWSVSIRLSEHLNKFESVSISIYKQTNKKYRNV